MSELQQIVQQDGTVLKLANGIFPNLFDDIVGQEFSLRKVQFYLQAYRLRHHIPNLLITSQKGNGKTTISLATSAGLYKFDNNGNVIINSQSGLPVRKKVLPINCSNLKSVGVFFDDYVAPHIHDKDITVFFDEASEISHNVSMSLLTILKPNTTTTSYNYNGIDYNFDFKRQSFIFATSEPNKIFPALLDRLRRIDLEEYSLENLAQIVQKGAKQVQFEDGVLLEIASVSRGNGRSADTFANEVKTYLGSEEGKFSMEDWKILKGILNILPLGLNTGEVNILKYLSKSYPDGLSLTALAAKMGLTRESLQRDYELQLQKNSLMRIELAKGRTITAKGLEYLASLGNRHET